MKFNNLEELIKYIITENIELNNTDILFDNKMLEENLQVKEKLNETIDVKLPSLYGSPQITGSYGEENILFVESVEGTKNYCGAGKVNFLDRELLTNLCESDGTAYIKLTVDIGNKIVENIMFKLKPLEENNGEYKIILAKDILNE